MSRSRPSSYPLAGGSRSRRRLLMNQPEIPGESGEEEFPESPPIEEHPGIFLADCDQEPLIVVERDPRDVVRNRELRPEESAPASGGSNLSELDARELELSELKERLLTREHQLALWEQQLTERERQLQQEADKLRQLQRSWQKQTPSHSLLPGTNLLDEVRGLLQGPTPLTWVFTGENPVAGHAGTRSRRTYVEQFSDRIRGELGRAHDVVIDTAAPRLSLRLLLQEFPLRVLRFQPDVVSVMLSPYDCGEGRGGQREFQHLLRNLVDLSRENRFRLIFQTPNRLDFSAAPNCQALRGSIRILRETTAEFDLPLIDHWAYWKRKCTDDSQLKKLLDPNGISPNSNGHKALARLLFATLNIQHPVAPEHSGVGLEYFRE